MPKEEIICRRGQTSKSVTMPERNQTSMTMPYKIYVQVMVDTVPDTSNKSTPENVMFSIFSNAQSWNNGKNLVTDTSFWKWVAFYFFKGATAYEDHWIQTYVRLL